MLRSNGGEEQVNFGDEHRELTSLSPSAPITRPQTSSSDKTVTELNLQQTENRSPNELAEDVLQENDDESSDDKSDSKNSSTRRGRSGIVYDESGNQWDAEELERKQKNPYRWFIEKEREKQRAKGPSQDEQAATAMVNNLVRRMKIELFFVFDDLGKSSSQCFRTILRLVTRSRWCNER